MGFLNECTSRDLVKPPVRDEDGAMVCVECGTYVNNPGVMTP